jgi:quercetin dioxygenase-like cupin family protein
MEDIIHRPDTQAARMQADWGDLTWWASRSQGNSGTMTVGRCRLKPGQANPRHRHPNCGEVLVVMRGRIAHTAAGGGTVELGPGDSVSIPRGIPHQARNVGAEMAELFIAFDSADRETIGE